VPCKWGLVVRVAVGWNFLVHGYNKIMVGPTDAFVKAYADLGFTPPTFWFWSRQPGVASLNWQCLE
jgi:uncharacterized membrane protein YphA (DoxX/SURF4 family)